MIYKPTVLILGAGASCPFGFPSGKGLGDGIIGLKDDSYKKELLIAMGFDKKLIDDFINKLSGSKAQSIDLFLQHNSKSYIEIGKAAIAITLLQYENNDNFRNDDWYGFLWSAMNDADFNSFAINQVSIITYNYERSLEHYLFTVMSHLYGANDEELAIKLSQIPIVHLHGQLGLLPWQKNRSNNNQVIYPYGGIRYNYNDKRDDIEEEEKAELMIVDNAKKIKQISTGIKVLHEDASKDKDFITAFKLFEKAAQIFFLGCGYHSANMDRLNISQFQQKTIIGTSYNMSGIVQENIINRYKIRLSNQNALDFLTNNVTFE
ncbi:MAG: hypothetical protein ABSA18_10625 [Dehalococcoidia bacterium]|jgi:hypothetical protein